MGTKASMGGLVALLKEGRLDTLDSSDYQSIFQMIYIPTASYNTYPARSYQALEGSGLMGDTITTRYMSGGRQSPTSAVGIPRQPASHLNQRHAVRQHD